MRGQKQWVELGAERRFLTSKRRRGVGIAYRIWPLAYAVMGNKTRKLDALSAILTRIIHVPLGCPILPGCRPPCLRFCPREQTRRCACMNWRGLGLFDKRSGPARFSADVPANGLVILTEGKNLFRCREKFDIMDGFCGRRCHRPAADRGAQRRPRYDRRLLAVSLLSWTLLESANSPPTGASRSVATLGHEVAIDGDATWLALPGRMVRPSGYVGVIGTAGSRAARRYR